MTARVILAVIILNAATMFGVIVADRVPPECVDSKNYLCGTPLTGVLDEQGDLKIGLNPLTIAASFVALVSTLGRLLWYDYTILNESDNTVVSLYVWTVRVIIFALALNLLYRAMPQVGNVLARFLGR